MQQYRNKWQQQWRLALMVLLFVAQQAALAAHPYGHDIDSETADCYVCVVAESSAGLSADPGVFTFPAFSTANEAVHASVHLPVIARWTSIRAPPFSFS